MKLREKLAYVVCDHAVLRLMYHQSQTNHVRARMHITFASFCMNVYVPYGREVLEVSSESNVHESL